MSLDPSLSQVSTLDCGTEGVKETTTAKMVNWEGLRKQARAIENDVDTKLVAFSKLGTNYKRRSLGGKTEDKQPLLGGPETEIEGLQQEIEGLLTRLGVINDEMAAYASGAAGSGGGAAVHHTLQRHTEILADYRGEFSKTSANIAAMMEREELLGSVSQDLQHYRGKDGGRNQKIDSLQRELEHTRNSERMIDEQINIALETRDNLVNQREILKAVQTKLNDLSSKFPLINSLVNKINLRKRRDTIILGCIIGVCLVFMIWYVFG